jgi:nucleoside-diphosphate-sugar epimerase
MIRIFVSLSRTLVALVLVNASLSFVAAALATPRTSIVTGANGYLGREIINVLLQDDDQQQDQTIICLVRQGRVETETKYWSGKSSCVRVMPYDMLDGGATIHHALEAATKDRTDDSAGISLYHVASVFGPSDNHVQTAKDNVQGTKDLVKVVAEFPACRLVVTSSMAAVRGSGQEPINGKYYTHKDWNTYSKLGDNWGASYQWSKAESERQAWALSKSLGISMTSICPSFVFGPPSDGMMTSSYSITLVGQWVRGESEVQSRLCVDIRDVAKAHVAAGTKDEAIGERIIVSKEERIPSKDMAEALKDVCRKTGLGDPDAIMYDSKFVGGAIAIGDKEVEATDRLETLLGIKLRPVRET